MWPPADWSQRLRANNKQEAVSSVCDLSRTERFESDARGENKTTQRKVKEESNELEKLVSSKAQHLILVTTITGRALQHVFKGAFRRRLECRSPVF